MNGANPLALIKVVEPKVAVARKKPVTKLEPSSFVAIPRPLSKSEPPALVAQTKEPFGLSFAMKISLSPELVQVVEPNVAVPSK